MAQKWNLQDIRPARESKPTLREVPTRKAQLDIAPRAPRVEQAPAFDDSDLASIDVVDGNTAKRKRVVVTSIVGALIIGTGFFINVLLGGAEVIVYPKLKEISVQANFDAFTKPKSGELGYELLILEAEGEKQVQAKGKETVSERAEGTIFVYNAKSSQPQRLIKNTRFETKEGLIFRIKESIEIPGVKKDAKGNDVPGKVVADVFADGTGEQYNVPAQRFTVPGLKGTDQYDSVYGESIAPFAGGFEGEKYIIDEAELDTAKQSLHIELRDKLLARLKEERPAGFIVYDGSITFVYESLPSTEYGESLATIKEKARLQVPMFKESEFSEFIAEATIPEYTGDPVTITEPYTLTFEYANATTTTADISSYMNLEFILKGGAQVVWTFDEKKLQNELVSLPKNDATKIFGAYTSISHAQAEVRPFWATQFPNNPEEINVITRLEKR